MPYVTGVVVHDADSHLMDAGWIIANAGDEVCLFSSDYPHIEGGRDPIKRFNEVLSTVPTRAVQRFYCDNFIDLMGEGLLSELRRPGITDASVVPVPML